MNLPRTEHSSYGLLITTLLLLHLFFIVNPHLSFAQDPSDFDLDRAIIPIFSRFKPFYVDDTVLLKNALERGIVKEETPLLLIDHEKGRLALLTQQMTHHHVAQGEIAGEPWLVSF